jgi:hypothetical protein
MLEEKRGAGLEVLEREERRNTTPIFGGGWTGQAVLPFPLFETTPTPPPYLVVIL